MYRYVSILLLVWVGECRAQSVTANVTCASCTSYRVTVGTFTSLVNCPAGTICSTVSTATAVCAAGNTCGGIVCDRFGIFPSPTNCQQFYVCRYRAGLGGYVLSPLTCPGGSRFDVNTFKCTLSPYANCYVAPATSTVVSTTSGTVSTTAAPAGGTTAAPAGGTTAAPAGGTTAAPAGGTTAAPAGGTTAAPVV